MKHSEQGAMRLSRNVANSVSMTRRSRIRKSLAVTIATVLMVLTGLSGLSGCSSAGFASIDDGRLKVVTTTGIIRDFVAHVAGDYAKVTSIVPDSADPHSYEPSLRKIRDIAYADLAFSNYLLLEEHSIIKALDANLPKDAPNIALAEEAVKHAAVVIPLVEDVSLDTVWLGLAVQGLGEKYGTKRSSSIELTATGVEGPGRLTAFLTGSFGDVDVYFDSSDGFDENDRVELPADAHTHLSWAFTEPGVYRLTLKARLKITDESKPITLGSTAMTFVVGQNTLEQAKKLGASVVIDGGHADLAVDLDEGGFLYRVDNTQKDASTVLTRDYYQPNDVVVEVPTKALQEIPADRGYRFLGNPRDKVYLLPQAVLGKHVHGEIDPHLWQNVRNAIAYVQTIEDHLSDLDPEHADEYHKNAAAYIDELEDTDNYVRDTIASIPRERRQLVTTHDAFAYLGRAYDVTIAGFVTPNPATEASLADRKKLTETIRNLSVPAVFLEPNLRARSSVLQQVANEQHIQVCAIYGDTFDGKVRSYVEMMRFNADSLKECLS